MRDYIHWATLGALCEFLPQPDNRVTLADETDRHGLPVAHFSYSQCDNDKQLIKAATAVMEDILRAAGASEVMTIDRYAHLVGGARMAARPEDGVVDAEHRVFGVPNALCRRRQRAAHPGRSQPRADHHGPGRARRRPELVTPPAAAHRAAESPAVSSPAESSTTSTSPSITVPTPRTRSRRHPARGTPPPPSSSMLHAGGRDRAGLDLQQPRRRRRHHRRTVADVVTGRDAFDIGGAMAGDAPQHAATSAPAGWSCRRSAPSTSPGGTSRPSLLDVPLDCPAGTSSLAACRSTAPADSPPSTMTNSAEQVDQWQRRRLHRDEDQDRPDWGTEHRPRPRPRPPPTRTGRPGRCS